MTKPASPPQHLAPGTVLHGQSYQYEIDRVLGQGSFGITYLASVKLKGHLGALQTKLQVAIKEFCVESLATRNGTTLFYGTGSDVVDGYMRKFKREAANLSKLNHEGIVKVVEWFEENGTAYFVMEYIDGPSLEQYIHHHGPLQGKVVGIITGALCDALSYMHSRAMLHLDLKPGNVMIRRGGSVVLIDFGLSKEFEDDDTINTKTSLGSGTSGYAPIEQSVYAGSASGEKLPVTMDVYALGATMYKMLTGERPPDASMVLNEGLPEENLKLLGPMASVIEKAMSPIIKQRYQNVDALRADLGAVAYQKIPVPLDDSYGAVNGPGSVTPVLKRPEPTEPVWFSNGKYCWHYLDINYSDEFSSFDFLLSETGLSVRLSNLVLDIYTSDEPDKKLSETIRKAIYKHRSILMPIEAGERKGERTHYEETVSVTNAPDSEICYSAFRRITFRQDGDGAAAQRIAEAKAFLSMPELREAISKAWNRCGRLDRRICIPDSVKRVEIRYSVEPGNTGSPSPIEWINITKGRVECNRKIMQPDNTDLYEWSISNDQYNQFLDHLRKLPFTVTSTGLPHIFGIKEKWITITCLDREKGGNVLECLHLSMEHISICSDVFTVNGRYLAQNIVGGNMRNCTVLDVVNHIYGILPKRKSKRRWF